MQIWAEQGIPWTEVRARMPERADAETRIAATLLMNSIPRSLTQEIFDLADGVRSTREFFAVHESDLRMRLAEASPNKTDQEINCALELMGLMVEALIREAAAEE